VSAAGRLAVALGVAGLCAGALFVLLAEGPPAAAPTTAELAALEARMTSGARLHAVPPEVPVRGSAGFCRDCHPPAPHRGRRVRDAMANAHAAWMDCLGCHWAEEGGARPDPVWTVGPGGGAFAGILGPESATPGALAALRAKVTARRPCFARGPACEGCHRPGGMAAWSHGTGAPAEGERLERLEAIFTLAPGEKWYFPQFP